MPEKKRKLLWQIFPSFLIVMVLSLTAVTWYSTGFFRKYYLVNSEADLTTQGTLIRRELFGHSPDRVNKICKEIGRATQTRVTVVLPSGRVIGDSFGIVREMENHLIRPEIASALKGGKGVSVRHSDTLGQKMMYVALPMEIRGRISAVVRTAVSVSNIDSEIRSVQKNIIAALVVTLLAAAGVGLLVSRRITRPIEEMLAGARGFATGDLSRRLVVPDTEELSLLATTMNQMAGRLDEKIQSAENRTMELEAVLSSMKEGVIAIDLNEGILMVNRAAARIFDAPARELTGRNVHEIARNYDLQQFLNKALASHDAVEEDILFTGKRERVFNIHSTALCNSRGGRMGTLVIFHDITRIRRLETMHKDFAANVSHELKTPLTALKGFVETLQDLDGEEVMEKRSKFLTILEKNVNRLIALVDDLMVLSRLERKEGVVPVFDPEDLAPVVNSALSACRYMADKRDIRLHAEVSDDPFALMDPLLIEQAVVNLVNNALKYSEPGSEVSVEGGEKEGYAVIRVTDSGPGISQEHLPRIFERFYRVDRARSRELGGTGLGLAIVKHIVQYHGGEIRVESAPGKGSGFEIRLPLA
ncbi:MAG: PAS domain-containing protein [Desulfobacteraceae bacterium]|nr:PAS domain-containing protein [Desulfobacteraceae bacterium]